MKQKLPIILFTLFLSICIHVYSVAAQQERYNGAKSQEISEVDGVPVLLKHLPEYENVRSSAVFVTNVEGLRRALGERPVFDLVDFSAGTEAVTANYPAGKLLIIEYANPQGSTFADENFQKRLAATPAPIVYRRIGNYSAFVFDAADQGAAIALLDQIEYGKTVQWLGEDPYLLAKLERYFAITGRDVAISTVLWILMWASIVLVIGVASGFAFFQYRERQRAGRAAFSDAGGLTRLNLDDLSEPLA